MYEQLINYLKEHNKRKEAGFIQKYYLENKPKEIIVEELYINSIRTYYKIKKKIKFIVQNWKIDNNN